MRSHALAALVAAVLAAPAQAATGWCGGQCDKVVIDWNLNAHAVIKAAEQHRDPMSASRSLSMMHLAMHDAVNAVERRYRGFAYEVAAGEGGADAAVAAAVAAHDVLAALYPGQKALVQSQLDATLLDAGAGPAIERARTVGAAAAAAMLAKRANDGATTAGLELGERIGRQAVETRLAALPARYAWAPD